MRKNKNINSDIEASRTVFSTENVSKNNKVSDWRIKIAE